MTRSGIALGVMAVVTLAACEPSFVDVTFDGVPKCDGTRLTSEIVVKLEGPRVSSMHRLTGDGAPMTTKLVAGKLYKLKAYKCVSEPCESDANLFHGEEVTAPEGKTGKLTLSLPGAPACTPAAPVAPSEDAGNAADAG